NKSFCCDGGDFQLAESLGAQSATDTAPALYFYHPDHLGSTAMVTNEDGHITQNVVYIPFGEVFLEERNGSWASPYLFNAKELDEETGLYYYGARYLDPAGARWLSVDPMWNNDPDKTPYNYCLNNPVKLVDPDGRSTHTSEDGTVVAIYDDNDLGVYRHSAEDLNGFDYKTMLSNGYPLPNDNTKWVGETWTPFGFADFEHYTKTGEGEIIVQSGAIIDFSSNWGTEKISELDAANPNWISYGWNARSKKHWDFKYHTPGNNGKVPDPGYGSMLYGKYASARDVGNFGAGFVAAKSCMGKDFFDYGYGTYNQNDNSFALLIFSVYTDASLISYGQNQGLIYNQNYIDPITAGKVHKYGYDRINRMKHGEDKFSQMGIDVGYNYMKSRKQK
ncbi:MAG: RHS repeat-associated core domain-containing protein, partial [Paludibacteraceae bacterium]|nr:RHS repeat-associated core domain-containing protein [Paludibacteraceae bacterium]